MPSLPDHTLYPRAARPPRGGRVWFVPFTALALFVAAILVLLWFVHRHEAEIQLANLRRDTQYAELSITRKILAHQEFADRLAGAFASGQGAAALIDQAQAYQEQNPEIRNFVWFSADGMYGWTVPSWKDAVAIARERPPLEERERMQRLTSATGRSTYTEPYRDYQDEPYVEYHSPVIEHGSFRGTVSMTLSLRTVMQRLVPVAVTEKYRLSLLDAEGKPTHVHRLEVRDEASGLWYALRVRAVRWVDGRLVRMTMISDITDRKIADERNRVQHEKLLLTSRLMSVGEMASTLAHEINQPLSAIANYNMGAVRRLKSDHWKKEDLVSALEKSAAQAERAGRVVHRVREFLRRREPVREPMSINEVVVDVTELIELEAENASVQIRLDLGHDVPLVSGDRIMVEQLLLNLIKNGIEAMKQTRQAERELTVQTAAAGSQIEIRVIDRGHGIATEVAPELFSPFFTTKDNGMGMGLNICRSIVELHDGHLWFSANPAGGSIFHFTRPPAIEPAIHP